VGYSFFRSIRAQLLLLVLISVIPALGIVIYSGLDRQYNEIEKTNNNVLMGLQGLAYDHERAVEGTRQFLITLAKLPAIHNLNAPASNKLLGQLLKQYPLYASLFVINAEGIIWSSALPFTPQSVKHRKYFQDAKRAKDFSVGEYVISITAQTPVLHFSYPILDDRGRFKGVVGVSFNLAHYGKIFSLAKLPKGSTLNLLDHKYIRLYRYPDPEKYIGKADSPDIIKQMSAQPEEGVFTSAGVDGTKRLFAYKRFYLKGSTSPYLFMRIGIPYEQALAHVRQILFINMTLMLLAFIIAMVSAWFIGNVLIVRRLNKLVDASQQLGHGDLTARTGLDHKEDELGQMTKAFDEMAEELEQKESQRKLSEKALKQSEEKYRSIFENAVEGMFQSTPDGRFLSVNPALACMCGYASPEEMVASITDMAHQHYVDPEKHKVFKKLLDEQGLVNNFEHQIRRKDSSAVWVSINASAVRDENGNILYYEGTHENITRRKEAEESLKKEKETFFTILENDPSGVALIGRDGVYKYLNHQFTNITGYTIEDVPTGKDWFQKAYPDPEYRKKVIETWKKNILPEGKSVDEEFKITCKDGQQKDIEFRITFLKDFSIIVMNDITARRQAQNLLKESEERYRALTEKSIVGVYLVQNNLFRYVNNAFAEIHGCTPDEMIEKLGPIDLVLPEDFPLVTENINKRMSGDVESAHFEFRIRRRDGTIRHVEIFGSRSMHKGAPSILGTLVDITERKQLEDQLRTMSILDELTSLYNRRGFFTLSQQQMKMAERAKKDMLLFFADLDNMKEINDRLGHQEGDKALVEIATVLKETFRESDIIGRMGGDEFAALAIDTTDETREVLTARLQNYLDTHNKLETRNYTLSLSIGIAHYNHENPSSLDELMSRADTLMYEEKRKKTKLE